MSTETRHPIQGATLRELRTLAKGAGWDELSGFYEHFVYGTTGLSAAAAKRRAVAAFAQFGITEYARNDGFIVVVTPQRARA